MNTSSILHVSHLLVTHSKKYCSFNAINYSSTFPLRVYHTAHDGSWSCGRCTISLSAVMFHKDLVVRFSVHLCLECAIPWHFWFKYERRGLICSYALSFSIRFLSTFCMVKKETEKKNKKTEDTLRDASRVFRMCAHRRICRWPKSVHCNGKGNDFIVRNIVDTCSHWYRFSFLWSASRCRLYFIICEKVLIVEEWNELFG